MKIPFWKYHGAGNDFILMDDRKNQYSFGQEQIKHFCDRHLSIGADGLMLLKDATNADFSMTYFNADGKEGTLCGNGGRCITAFANHLGIIQSSACFQASDGLHHAEILEHSDNSYRIRMQMQSVDRDAIERWIIAEQRMELPAPVWEGSLERWNINDVGEGYTLDTGSPHLVFFVRNASAVDVVSEGRRLRNFPEFDPDGINVDFVEIRKDGSLFVRTYERGVENETLSCGTGVTAAALVLEQFNKPGVRESGNQIVFNSKIRTKGGILQVSFRMTENQVTDIWLEGPVVSVFSGKIKL